MQACFSRITVLPMKPYPACSWRSSLKYTRKSLLCLSSPQPLSGRGLLSSLPPLDTELAQSGRHRAPPSCPRRAWGSVIWESSFRRPITCASALRVAAERLGLGRELGRMSVAPGWSPWTGRNQGNFSKVGVKPRCKQEAICS